MEKGSLISGLLGSRIILSKQFMRNFTSAAPTSTTAQAPPAPDVELDSLAAQSQLQGADLRVLRRDELISLLLRVGDHRDALVSRVRATRSLGELQAMADELALVKVERDTALEAMRALRDAAKTLEDEGVVDENTPAGDENAVKPPPPLSPPESATRAGGSTGSRADAPALDGGETAPVVPPTTSQRAFSDGSLHAAVPAARYNRAVALASSSQAEAALERVAHAHALATTRAALDRTVASGAADAARLQGELSSAQMASAALTTRLAEARMRANALAVDVEALRLENSRLKVALSHVGGSSTHRGGERDSRDGGGATGRGGGSGRFPPPAQPRSAASSPPLGMSTSASTSALVGKSMSISGGAAAAPPSQSSRAAGGSTSSASGEGAGEDGSGNGVSQPSFGGRGAEQSEHGHGSSGMTGHGSVVAGVAGSGAGGAVGVHSRRATRSRADTAPQMLDASICLVEGDGEDEGEANGKREGEGGDDQASARREAGGGARAAKGAMMR